MFTLRYAPGTPLGERFPLWRFGRFDTREAGEAVRHECANGPSIEVVEDGVSPVTEGDSTPQTWENGGGPSGVVDATRPGPDHRSLDPNGG